MHPQSQARAKLSTISPTQQTPRSTLRRTTRQPDLRYVNEDTPGILRQRDARAHNRFAYIDALGNMIDDRIILERIQALALPESWEEVWICPWANGHIQATGRDAHWRKQYRYHARWRAVREATTFARLHDFVGLLPQIRATLDHDLRKTGISKSKVLATMIDLLQVNPLRSIPDDNADASAPTEAGDRTEGGDIRFHLRGNSGVQHSIKLHDPYMLRIAKKLIDLPGQDLFHFLDAHGQAHAIGSTDVNHYLHDVCGEPYTVKDFRTWTGTVLAALLLDACPPSRTPAQTANNIARMLDHVATKLGDTAAICRKCYVHPEIIEAYLEGITLSDFGLQANLSQARPPHALNAAESAVLSLLRQDAAVPRAVPANG